MKTRNSCRKSAKWALVALVVSGAALCVVGEEEKCPVSANVRGHENIEWSISYAYGLTDATRNLPRALLIGDSICNGYQGGVRERLKGKMNVTYWVSSYCATSPAYLPLLAIYLDEAKYDVIHFNNGLHSLGTPTDAWANGLKAALELVRRKQPDAKLVWCSSTPLANDVKTAKCRELNAAAAKVVAELGGIATDDLSPFAIRSTAPRTGATNTTSAQKPRPGKPTKSQAAACRHCGDLRRPRDRAPFAHRNAKAALGGDRPQRKWHLRNDSRGVAMSLSVDIVPQIWYYMWHE